MALLNPPGQLPSVARIIYRYLLHLAGPKGEKKDRLEQLLRTEDTRFGREHRV